MKLNQMILILVILGLVMGCQKKQGAEEQEATATAEPEACTIAEVPAFSYVCLPFTGGYEYHEKVIGDLIQAAGAQGIELSGPMLGIYYNSPTEVSPESLKWEIGFEVSDSITVAEPLVVKKWEFTKVVKGMHTGPYENVGETYPKIFEFIGKQNMMPAGPTMERFLGNTEEVAPESLKIEIWIPVSGGQ